MAIKKKKLAVPHFEFESLPAEISLSGKNLEALKVEFELVEKGIFFEGGNQFHLVSVLSKKEDSTNEKLDGD